MPRRRPEIPLVLLALGAYAWFYQAGGWNQNSRFDLTRAIVEGHTIAIDAYADNTGDKAERGGHWYTDKAPGLSLLAVPAYALVHAVRPEAVAAGAYAANLFANGLPAALAVGALFLFGRDVVGLGAPWAAAIAAAYGLGTLAWPYATVFYGHQLAASLGLIAFVLIASGRAPVVAGLLLGGAVCVDYTAAILALGLTACAAVRLGPRGAALVVAGGAPMALALGAYHAAAFGGPLALPYAFDVQEHRRMGWFMGIGPPDPRVAWGLLFGSYRGLLFGAPWLVAGFAGLVPLARRHRAEAVTAGGIALAYLLLNASLVDWPGGWAMGPRYLIPAIPFLAVGAMGLPLAWPEGSAARRALGGAGGAAAAVSVALMLIGTAVRPDVPLTVERPFQEFLVPSFVHGRVARSNHPIDRIDGVSGTRAAWNLGHLAGLDGLWTLVPLMAWMAATALWLARAAAKPTTSSSSSPPTDGARA